MENHNNMYTDIEYKKIKEKYGACASWAIWDVNDLSDTTIIENNILNLQNNYVLLALNKSIDIDLYCWKNFHGYDHARKLAYGCNNSLLRGSYMTDLFKDLPEAVASRLDKNLSSNDIEKNISFFVKEMKDVKLRKDSKFIVFGKVAEKYFLKYFKQYFENKFIIVRHYSDFRKSDEQWASEFLGQIKSF